MPEVPENRLTPGEVEIVLRRAAELRARRKDRSGEGQSVSPEVLVQVAAAAGISEHDVRRALFDLYSDRTAEPFTPARRFYGPSRLRSVREVQRPAEVVREHLEDLLRREQGLKMRQKTEGSSIFDAGDLLGTVRRALDFSGNRSLHKARSVELRVEDVEQGRAAANLTADVSNQRSEYLSLSGILGATLALPLAIAGFAGTGDWVYFLGVLPALAAPAVGFKLAYQKACTDARRTMDGLLDAAEEGYGAEQDEGERRERPPGQVRGLKPIPKYTRPSDE
ncbi:hypothetical protein GBA65_12040 [Rubrobacter marinus]|uniref:Uncharacterized protein n=1 Tax=Rubrobacter marinus TaxID=2653852 RepID=A0A6G8PY53_9ACTN|nr:hypothetical protein [Rubrobacter marinus]QIN79133.1 hypothetical protein GBA65_12040 [Rubrobacter marinus]